MRRKLQSALWRALLLIVVCIGGTRSRLIADVTTEHNDNNRTGANLGETSLDTKNVNSATFGKLFSLPVDGYIYAQPLYVSDVTIPSQGVHNVVYICTQHNSVYAYDADAAAAPLWQVNLGPSIPISVFGTASQEGISVEVGILSTPVIDPSSGTMFVVSATYESNVVIYRLHALDIASGAEKLHGPAVIGGSVPGTGVDNSGGIVTFSASKQLQRPGLLLLNGNIYIAFGSHGDDGIWHGWLFGYSATTLSPAGVFCTSPNSQSSGIWQSGIGPAADSAGNIYLVTGNGLLDANTGGADYGDSVLKLSTAGALNVIDYFSPANQSALNGTDQDFGSGGPVLIIPGTVFGVAGGKDGNLYVFNTNNLGQFSSTSNNIVQTWNAGGSFFGGSVFYDSTLYTWGSATALKAYSFNGSNFNTTPSSQGPVSTSVENSTSPLSISANGTIAGTGILWASSTTSGDPHAGGPTPGVLQAFDASNVASEIWNSNQVPSRDSSGSWAKYCPPTIANGKVYLGSFDGILNVYGLLDPPGPPASVTAASGNGQVTTIGTMFPAVLQTRVRDSNNNLLTGVTVTFTLPASGATATFSGSTTASVVTGAGGIATSPVLTANSVAGGYAATASVSGVSTVANFSLANTTVANIIASGGTPQTTVVNTNFGAPLQATVLDTSGNPVSGVTVTFSAPMSGPSGRFGSSLTVNGVTNAAGVATAPALTANKTAGAYSVTANVLGVETPANYTLTNAAGPAATVIASGGTPQGAVVGAPFVTPLQATVKDAYGNSLSGITVTFTAPTSGATATFAGSPTATVVTNASGVAVSPTPVANSVIGGYSASASVTGIVAASFTLSNIAFRFAAFVKQDTGTQGNWRGVYGSDGYNVIGDLSSNPSYVTPAAAGQSSFTWAATTTDARGLQKPSDPTSRIAATWYSTSSFSINLNITDSAIHQIALYCLDWDNQARNQMIRLVDSSGTVLDSRSISGFSGGVYLVWNVVGNVTLQVSLNSGPNAAISGIFLSTPSPAQSITAVAGAPQLAPIGTAFRTALQAKVADGSANPVIGVPVVFTAPTTGAGGSFGASTIVTVVTDSSGVATAPTLMANLTAGSFNVTSQVSGVTAPANFTLTNTAAAAITAVAGTPQSTGVGAAFGAALQARVLDGSSNPVSGVTVTFTAPASGASGMFGTSASTTAVTDGTGTATAPMLTANTVAGTFTVTAAVGGVAMPASFSLTNTAGTPVSVTASGGTPQGAGVGSGFATALQAVVKDGFGNTVSGVSVTFTAPLSGASGVFGGSATATVVTNASGTASAPTLTANTVVGSYTVTASTTGVGGTASYNLTNTAVPASISATAGTPQSAVVNTTYGTVLAATVLDAMGNPVSGAVVTFTAPASGASGTFGGAASASAVTNAGGIASAPALKANTVAGAYTVTAAVAGVGTAASFSVTNTAGAPVSVTASGGTPQSAGIGSVYPTPLQATVKDAFGNAVSGTMVTFTAPGTGASGTFSGLAATTAVSNASGTAAASVLTANTVAGPYTVTGAVVGVGTAASFSLTNTAAAAASISATGGTPQTTATGAPFGAALQAMVMDGFGNPVAGLTVTFTAPSSGASATLGGTGTTTATTNASGVATSPVPVANSAAGTYAVTATVAGVGTPASFNLTNTAAAPPTATFFAKDTTTQGNWIGVYGSDGYNVIGDLSSNPVYVTPAPAGQSSYTWATTTTDVRGLQKASSPTNRIAAVWYAANSFTIDLNITDAATHQVALYFLDWDNKSRQETVTVSNTSGTVLNTQTITGFSGGAYLVWNVTGHVVFKISRTGGPNAAVSGMFFAP